MNIDNLKDYKIKNDYLYSLELIRLFNEIFSIFLTLILCYFVIDIINELNSKPEKTMTDIRRIQKGWSGIIDGIFFVAFFLKLRDRKSVV